MLPQGMCREFSEKYAHWCKGVKAKTIKQYRKNIQIQYSNIS